MQLPSCLHANWVGLRFFSITTLTWVWYTTFSNVLAITDVTLMLLYRSEFSLAIMGSIFGKGLMFALIQESS